MKCKNCGVESDCTVAGGFCNNCKQLYISKYRGEVRKLQWKLYKKYMK